ncbi:MAG: zinc-dependent alcohol dehydrogenase [Candidatus Helarchaeota archaeon]
MALITLEDTPLPQEISAVVLEEPFQLKYTKIPMWPLESFNDLNLLLVKVEVCGVCGSDFRYYQGENPWSQHTLGIHLDNPPNIVLGHEFAGIVVAVLGEENRKWLGKRVVPICSKVCGICEYCTTKRAHLCENTIHLGHGQGWGDLSYYPGAYAEYVPAWGSGCYEIPEKVSYEDAAMMDVLAVCTHAYFRANHNSELPLLIMGAGPIGNGIAQVARINGVKEEKIIILERNEMAIRIAEKVGLQKIIHTAKKDISEIKDEIYKISKRKIFSIFDGIGSDFSFNLGMKLLDKGGTYVNLAVHNQKIRNLNQMQLSSERNITTSSNFSISAYERAWKWLQAGKFILDPWYSRVSLAKIPTIFEEIIKNKQEKPFFKLIISFKNIK